MRLEPKTGLGEGVPALFRGCWKAEIGFPVGSCKIRSAGQLVWTAHAISMENIENLKEEAIGIEG